MIPTKQTVYLPTSDSNVELQVGRVDQRDYYKNFQKVKDVYEEERFVFTQEELNNYTEKVIKQTLETAAEKAKTEFQSTWKQEIRGVQPDINKQSITNTFEETFKKFEV